MLQHLVAQIHFLLHLLIALEKLDGIIAQVIAIDLAFDGLFNVGQCMLHAATEDMGALGMGVIPGQFHSFFCSFGAAFAFQGGNLQYHTAESFAQLLQVDIITVFANQIDHVDCHYDRMAQLNQLGGQVQIALNIGAVNDI